MRFLRTEPKDKEFYNEHGGNLSAYQLIANLGQALSAVSLSLAVYSLLRDALAGRGISTASWVISGIALAVGIFIELANRKLSRPAIRPLVVKDQFADKPDKRSRHELLTRWSRIGLAIVGSLSLILSYMGSMDFGEIITAEVDTVNLDSLENSRQAPLAAIEAQFSADTTVLLAPFTARVQAANSEFAATRAAKEKERANYRSCARRGNAYCIRKRRDILAEIDQAQAALSASLATIAVERGQALAEVLKSRNSALEALNRKTDGAISEAKAANEKAIEDRKAKASGNGYLFAVLTLSGQLVFYLMMYLILQIQAGSEIEQEIQPNEFWNLPPVLADLRAVIDHRTERGARRLIRHVFGERDRLSEGLPYIELFEPTSSSATAPAAAPLTCNRPASGQASPVSAKYVAPGYYPNNTNPHRQNRSSALYSTPTAPARSTKRPHETKELREIKQRLKMYKKRLGSHEQKAIVQRRNGGKVKTRTAQAIENNRRWVNHYEKLLNEYRND